MTVVVLYFAALRDLVGTAEERLEISEPAATVAGLAELLCTRYPALRPHLPSIRFAVNEAFASAAQGLSAGDTVALIPPVSGG